MGQKLFSLPNHGGLILAGIVVLVIFALRIIPLFFSRSKVRTNVPLGVSRNYGIAGGTICPKCHRPFPLSLWGINVGLGTKLARCEFCGKWSLVRRRSQAELQAAEAAELAEAQPASPVSGQSETEKTKDRLDETRFTDK